MYEKPTKTLGSHSFFIMSRNWNAYDRRIEEGIPFERRNINIKPSLSCFTRNIREISFILFTTRYIRPM